MRAMRAVEGAKALGLRIRELRCWLAGHAEFVATSAKGSAR